MKDDARRAALHPGGLEHGVHRSAITVGKAGQNLRLEPCRVTSSPLRWPRRCEDWSPEQGHSLRRRVEQRPIASLDLAKLPIILFAFLLYEL